MNFTATVTIHDDFEAQENKGHGIWSHHFMANRWGTLETVTNFILGGSNITADDDCSHEIKDAYSLEEKL